MYDVVAKQTQEVGVEELKYKIHVVCNAVRRQLKDDEADRTVRRGNVPQLDNVRVLKGLENLHFADRGDRDSLTRYPRGALHRHEPPRHLVLCHVHLPVRSLAYLLHLLVVVDVAEPGNAVQLAKRAGRLRQRSKR